jgi:lactate permease
MLQIWPAILVTGVSFAIPQFLISNFMGPMLVDVGASLISMACLVLFLRVWHPEAVWTSPALRRHDPSAVATPAQSGFHHYERDQVVRAWMPWIILTVFVFLWGLPSVKAALNGLWTTSWQIPGLHNAVTKVPPVVAKPTTEAAVWPFPFFSLTGTGILFAAILSGLVMGFSPAGLVKQYARTIWRVRLSLLTIAAMLGLGTLTRYAGLDATMGLAFATTGVLYPLFGTMLGWLGVALTGSDTASNVLFGGLQKITATQLGLSPVLMAAANSSGGVMGKMIDAQSIVVASTATNWFGHEGTILRFVFFHSVALAVLVGLLVTLQAYVHPFTAMVVHLPVP